MLYTFSKIVSQSTNLVKFHVSSQKSEILHFHGLLLPKSYKVSAEKVHKIYLSSHWRVTQSLKKNWLVFSNMIWGIWWIFTQPLKSLKILLQWVLFSKVYKGWAKKYRGVIFHDTGEGWKIWINAKLVVSKITWGIGWTFIRALKSLKFGLWWALFFQSIFHRNYVSWHWRVMQNLKESWLVAWKMK